MKHTIKSAIVATIVLIVLGLTTRISAQIIFISGQNETAKLNNRAIKRFENNDYDGAIKLLQKAIDGDHNNAELEYNIGTTYMQACIVDETVNYYDEASEAFKKALSLSPNNANYYYQLGSLYFNHAVVFNNGMNKITGSSNQDRDNYYALKSKRDSRFSQAEPFLEKAYGILNEKELILSSDELKMYKNTMKVLMDIYSRLNKTEKYQEIKQKLASMN